MTQITIQDCIDLGEKRFKEAALYFGHGTNNAADEALWLVFYVLKLPWDVDASVLQNSVTQDQYQEIQQLFERRVSERIPAAYITGESWFMGLPFIVNEHVLVPRSPLAECIAVNFSPFLPQKPQATILDLCTGSGCIGIATALKIPDAKVALSDISADAIAVAKQNISQYELQDRVTAIESDLFEGLKGQRFDLIVSNPPYVDAEDFSNRPDEYRAEPDIALASGVDGLDFTRRLLKEAADYLEEGGSIIVELGNSGRHLEAAFPSVPFLWLEFEHGGHGVFVLTREELRQFAAVFT